jgi:GABA permease
MTRVLVIAMSSVDADAIDAAIGARFGESAEVRVVAPASGLSRLDWLTNAEDDERSEAAARAREVAQALPADHVQARVGDSDPVQAIDDAVRTFDPDQVVVVSHADEDSSWLETGTAALARERLDIPVTHIVVP